MRNYGIDLLRIVSMYMVVIIHTLSYGGILESSSGISHSMIILLQTIVYCAVNCFSMISGYVTYSDNNMCIKYSKYIKLWVQVVFYGVIISGFFFLISSETTSFSNFVYSFVPVFSNRYWYFTAYTVCFFLSPFLNKMIRKCSCRELSILVIVIVFLFSIYSSVAYNFGGDIFYLVQGFSAFWLLMMYIIGAWIKKVNISKRINLKWIFLVTVSVLITWIVKSFCPKVAGDIIGAYTSPTILLNSIIFVALFSKLKIGHKGLILIKFMSPAVFGVYLIHNNSVIRDNYMRDAFLWVSNLNYWVVPFVILFISACIFLVCILIEKVRLFLFKISRIDKMLSIIGNCIDTSISKFLETM